MCHALLEVSLATPFVSMFASQKMVLKADQRWLKGPMPWNPGRGKPELPSWLSHLRVGVASLFPKAQFSKLQDTYFQNLPNSPCGLSLLFSVSKLRDSPGLRDPVATTTCCLFTWLSIPGFISTHLASDTGAGAGNQHYGAFAPKECVLFGENIGSNTNQGLERCLCK